MIIVISDNLFCRNLRYLRIKHRYSQKRLAEMIGISVYSLRNMESGKYVINLKYENLKRLCAVFQVSAEQLLQEELAA